MLARVMPPTPTPPPRRAAADVVENGSGLNSAWAPHTKANGQSCARSGLHAESVQSLPHENQVGCWCRMTEN